MKKLAILASGNGTNAENIYNFFSKGNRIEVSLVIYDRAAAGVADRMKAYGVETVYIPKSVWENNPAEIIDLLKAHSIDLVVLAGFLRVIPSEITQEYAGRIINIHPSLLPAYGGMGMFGHKVHEAVMAAGETKSGVTVHYVTEEVDGGEILMQEEVEITPEDTAETLESKIHEIEYSLFPRAIVAALRKLDEEVAVPPELPHTSQTPPPLPSPAEEWAETLGVKYDESKLQPEVESIDHHEAEPPRIPQPNSNGNKFNHIPAHKNEELPPMPQTYLVWSILMTIFCCMPAGIVAIIFASQVSSKYYMGDYEGAVKSSERAQIWIIISFVLGLLTTTLYLPFLLIAG